MKPAPFAYIKPSSLDELFLILEAHGEDAVILAGGQSLVASLNLRLDMPDIVVDINGLAELSGIETSKDRLRIGALTRHKDIEGSRAIAKHAPLLRLAAPHIAHPAVRNRGTIGGSVALGDPAAEWPACIVALDGEIELKSAKGVRKIKADKFYQGLYETALQPGELVSAIEVPVAVDGHKPAFCEFTRRHGDYAMAGLAASAMAANGKLDQIRLVFFSIGACPILALGAAKALQAGGGDEALVAAQRALDDDLEPIGDLNCAGATKLHFAKQLLAQATLQLRSGT